MAESRDFTAKLRKIIKVSTRVRQDQMRTALGIDPVQFDQCIFDWAEEFGFKIDGDYINFAGSDVDAFVKSLDAEFKAWKSTEREGDGKKVENPVKTVALRPESVHQSKVSPPSSPAPISPSISPPPTSPPVILTTKYVKDKGVETIGDKEREQNLPLDPAEHGFLAALQTELGEPAEGSYCCNIKKESSHITELELDFQLYDNKHAKPSFKMLADLPNLIGNLSALRILKINRAEITRLPDEIGNLANLQELCITRCKLITLPPTIGKITSLKDLDLSENKLKLIPPEIGDLCNLQTLALDHNKDLKDLPGSMVNIKTLDTLWVDGGVGTKVVKQLKKAGVGIYHKLSLSQRLSLRF